MGHIDPSLMVFVVQLMDQSDQYLEPPMVDVVSYPAWRHATKSLNVIFKTIYMGYRFDHDIKATDDLVAIAFHNRTKSQLCECIVLFYT